MTVLSNIADLLAAVSTSAVLLFSPHAGEKPKETISTESAKSGDDKSQLRLSMGGGDGTGAKAKTPQRQSKSVESGSRSSSVPSEDASQVSRGSSGGVDMNYQPSEIHVGTPSRDEVPRSRLSPRRHGGDSSPSHQAKTDGTGGSEGGGSHRSRSSGGGGGGGKGSSSSEEGDTLTPEQLAEYKKQQFEQALKKNSFLGDGNPSTSSNSPNPTQDLLERVSPEIAEKLKRMTSEEFDDLRKELDSADPSSHARILHGRLRGEVLPPSGKKPDELEK